MQKSIRFPLIISSVVVLWMLSGIFSVTQTTNSSNLSTLKQKMTVEATKITSQEISDEIVLQGEVEPLRKITIRSHTAAHVLRIIGEKGSFVVDGSLLFRLATADRSAQFFSAKAELTAVQDKKSQLQELVLSNPSMGRKLEIVSNEVAMAETNLRKMISERGNILIKTPFSGVLEDYMVEVGSHVEKGDALALILDESIVKAVGYVSQQSIRKLHLGQEVTIHLLDGQEAKGKLSYIASSGDEKTHSFKVEAQLANPAGTLKSGTSARMHITTGYTTAHFISAASLSLDIKGNVGVKAITEKDLVRFYPVQLLRTETTGIWITGLPHKLRIITQGHGFVSEGEFVEGVPPS